MLVMRDDGYGTDLGTEMTEVMYVLHSRLSSAGPDITFWLEVAKRGIYLFLLRLT